MRHSSVKIVADTLLVWTTAAWTDSQIDKGEKEDHEDKEWEQYWKKRERQAEV